MPNHIAVIMDGNRRWARSAGFADLSVGHKRGAEHLEEVLGWCTDLGIRHVTVWVASADNTRRRDPAEVAFLMQLAESTIPQRLTRNRQWRIHVAGQMDILPDATVRALKEAVEATRCLEAGDLTIAIGYGGREEIAAAVRAVLDTAAAEGRSLADLAAAVSEEHRSTSANKRTAVSGFGHPDQWRAENVRLPSLASGARGPVFRRRVLAILSVHRSAPCSA